MSGTQCASTVDLAPSMGALNPTAVAVALRGREGGATAELGDEVGNALRASSGGGDKAHVLAAMMVRRLTVRECERLQGFPDDYTLIPYGRPSKAKLDADFIKYQMRGNPKHLARDDVDRLASDGPRYKSLGNSWAIPNVRWIGQRINAKPHASSAQAAIE
jgi:DNA (cytosine-5)-methyltransferase 1